MDWSRLIERIAAQVVMIQGETGVQGTGFLIGGTSAAKTVATARHVVDAVMGRPARVCHYPSGKYVRIGKEGPGVRDVRVVKPSSPLDVALLLFFAPEFPQPAVPIVERPSDVRVGTEVGWLGYPSRLPETLCFFSGRISAALPNSGSFVIDGVGMPGVSGGPVFCETAAGLRLVGSVSAYAYDVRKTGPTTEHSLPGLAVANDVSFHNTVEITEHDASGIAPENDGGTPSDVIVTVKNIGKPPNRGSGVQP